MINPRELRIGNLVKCLVHLPIGFNKPALTYSEIRELREDRLETNEGVYRYRDVSPLTLSEEILLKSGGEKVSDSIIKFSDTSLVDIYIVVDNHEFFVSNEVGEKYSIKIESVHQFQNLYFELKRKEANIKLK